MPMALVCAGALAIVVGYPCFRFLITGHYFVLVTLALSGIVLQIITATRDYTGGSLRYTPERTTGSHLLALQFDDKTTRYMNAPRLWGGGFLIWRWGDRTLQRSAPRAYTVDHGATAMPGPRARRDQELAPTGCKAAIARGAARPRTVRVGRGWAMMPDGRVARSSRWAEISTSWPSVLAASRRRAATFSVSPT